MRTDESAVLIEGPWSHRDVSAGGIRLHVAEAGTGPLVVLLHGFPQFWWMWRHQLVALAEAGYRAVAPDLRGYGATDKTPRGYDAWTLVTDVVGLIRALGERDAMVVGQDWGAILGWCAAVMHPDVVRRLVVLGTPHPLRARAALADHRQIAASGYLARFQLPWHPEHWLADNDAANVATLLREWAGPGFPDPDSERRYRDAMQIPGVAHSALEYYRWLGRSQLRPDGLRFARAMRRPAAVPTLQLHGELDGCILPASAQGSGRYVSGPYEWRLLTGVGHFLAEEAPDAVTGELLRWAKEG